jgi:hypothetical protein
MPLKKKSLDWISGADSGEGLTQIISRHRLFISEASIHVIIEVKCGSLVINDQVQ